MRSATGMRENNLGALSQYTDLAAEQIEKAAAWLRTTTPEEIARNVEDFAKKQPELFAAGAAVLGLIGLRLLRNTGQNGDEKREQRDSGPDRCFRRGYRPQGRSGAERGTGNAGHKRGLYGRCSAMK